MNPSRRVVHLLCGVPGSGKTWCINQVRDLFNVVENDRFLGKVKAALADEIADAAQKNTKPILADCPFGERELRDILEQKWDFDVFPLFIIETPDVIMRRYMNRNGHAPGKATITRAQTIRARADEWRAVRGTSTEMLANLRIIAAGGKIEAVAVVTTQASLWTMPKEPEPLGFAPFDTSEGNES